MVYNGFHGNVCPEKDDCRAGCFSGQERRLGGLRLVRQHPRGRGRRPCQAPARTGERQFPRRHPVRLSPVKINISCNPDLAISCISLLISS